MVVVVLEHISLVSFQVCCAHMEKQFLSVPNQGGDAMTMSGFKVGSTDSLDTGGCLEAAGNTLL